MADERVRVEIGFEGGQVVGGFVDARSADELEARAASNGAGGRSSRSRPRTGRYHVVVAQVAYFKRFNRPSRVGFGSAS